FPKIKNEGHELIRETDLLSSNSFYSIENNPNNYIKPFDIAKIFKFEDGGREVSIHSAIYLGSDKVIHVSGAGGAGFSTKTLWKNPKLQQNTNERSRVEIIS